MIPTPIRQALSTIQKHGVQALLMGGQACVFYGAAQVSKDIDVLVLVTDDNIERLRRALDELQAERIAVPSFDPGLLCRGHAVHFRCQASGVESLRVDVMARLRGLPDFESLWNRRTVFADDDGHEFHLLSVPDLVLAKKTQRSKDWPVIELLVTIHHRENSAQPRPEFVRFWLLESRTAELVVPLTRQFPGETSALEADRPLLTIAESGDLDALRAALDAELRAEQAKDRAYWEPLRKELEEFRRAERQSRQSNGGP